MKIYKHTTEAPVLLSIQRENVTLLKGFDMALSKTTQDHDEIRRWAEARGAVPAEVADTDKGRGTGLLRFCFPKAPNKNNSGLKEISWDEFFEKFDKSDLELIYQEKTAAGEESNFNKLVHPDDEEHSSRKSGKSGSSGSHSKSHKSHAA